MTHVPPILLTYESAVVGCPCVSESRRNLQNMQRLIQGDLCEDVFLPDSNFREFFFDFGNKHQK